MGKGQVEGGKALQAARAAELDAASHRPTAAQKQQQIAELEERAVLFGDPVKQSAQAKVLERKWLRFLLVHGEEYEFVARAGPTVELVEHFVTYAFCTRDLVSAIGREGLGDSFELQIRYMLAKFVFVALKYNGWEGLNALVVVVVGVVVVIPGLCRRMSVAVVDISKKHRAMDASRQRSEEQLAGDRTAATGRFG